MAKKYESRTEMHLPVSQEMLQVGKRLIDTVWSETRIASENLILREEQIAVQRFDESKVAETRQAPPN
jgi:hypothetical protein